MLNRARRKGQYLRIQVWTLAEVEPRIALDFGGLAEPAAGGCTQRAVRAVSARGFVSHSTLRARLILDFRTTHRSASRANRRASSSLRLKGYAATILDLDWPRWVFGKAAQHANEGPFAAHDAPPEAE